MLDTFLSPATTPFAVAIGLMLVITLVELIGTLMGMPASAAIDSVVPEFDVDIDADLDLDVDGDISAGPLDVDGILDAPSPGPLSQLLGWLCVGKVPVLVLLVIILTAFGLTGFAVQGAAGTLLGAPLPAWLASIPAFLIALPVTRHLGLGIAKIMPKEETEAISQRQFIGKVAVITQGHAKSGLAAEAKLTDKFGQSHYLRVEPDDAEVILNQGTEIIIVRQSGAIYKAIENTNAAMSDSLDT